MAVLPESMDRLDRENVAGSLSVLENYIRYMGERIEFSMQNVTRQVSAAGVSNAEIYVLITAINNTLSALQSTVNGLQGTVTGLAGGQGELEEALSGLQAEVTGLRGTAEGLRADVTALQGVSAALGSDLAALRGELGTGLEGQGAEIGALRADLAALAERVSALETPAPDPEPETP